MLPGALIVHFDTVVEVRCYCRMRRLEPRCLHLRPLCRGLRWPAFLRRPAGRPFPHALLACDIIAGMLPWLGWGRLALLVRFVYYPCLRVLSSPTRNYKAHKELYSYKWDLINVEEKADPYSRRRSDDGGRGVPQGACYETRPSSRPPRRAAKLSSHPPPAVDARTTPPRDVACGEMFVDMLSSHAAGLSTLPPITAMSLMAELAPTCGEMFVCILKFVSFATCAVLSVTGVGVTLIVAVPSFNFTTFAGFAMSLAIFRTVSSVRHAMFKPSNFCSSATLDVTLIATVTS